MAVAARTHADISKAVILISASPLAMFGPANSPINNFKELVAYAKARPDKVTYGSGGSGSTGHISMEMVKKQAGIDLLHVPYKGVSYFSCRLTRFLHQALATYLEWLKTPSKRHGPSSLAETLEKVHHLKSVGAQEWDLDAVALAKQQAEGNVVYIKWTVRAVSLPGKDGKPELSDNGFWEVVSGTGSFKGLKGAGSLHIKPANPTDCIFILDGQLAQ